MTTKTTARRARYLQLGAPAAVLGALAGALASTPAEAAEPAPLAAHPERATGLRVLPAQTAPARHVVQPGDTIAAIAARYGLRTADVLAWNGLSWRSVIYPGQTIALRAAAPAASPAPAPAPSAAAAVHTVVAGDTVYAIAQKHGTTVDAILAANDLSRTSVIYPGQKLAVSGSAAATPTVAPATAAPAASTAETHTVVPGDTVFAIAQKYGTTTAALLSANGLGAGSLIYPGQKLVVRPAPAPAAAATSPGGQLRATLTPEQASNAALIIRVGRELGVSDRAIALALATGMVESSLRNLHGGDRDSLGLFQQRPSMGWGTPTDIMDPERSTRVFFGGPHDPNGTRTRGLLDIPGWESMRFTDAAQAVQISAYPHKYGQWETQAYAWLGLYG